METLDSILFYNIDKAIKVYRQFAQTRIEASGIDITIDQWMVLKALFENPEATQSDIAAIVFKDNASVSRIIELLIKKKMLKRKIHKIDRRRSSLAITQYAIDVMDELQVLIQANRAIALETIDSTQVSVMNEKLKLIIKNCQAQLK